MSDDFRSPATAEEWSAYHELRRRVLFERRGSSNAYDPHHPDDHCAGHYPFILWDGREAVGVIRVDVDGDVATLRRVAVREDVQRRGHGRRLLQAAQQFARERACTRLVSHVAPDAVGFYERCGFALVHAQRVPDGSMLMTKSL